ncbi:hypothetical protein BKI52_40820 [marine bacterium AO1-C]|nr:hypothetical protein BKI52_40820 [marine bacterium AO1-C]
MLNILTYKKVLWLTLAFCISATCLVAQNAATSRQTPQSILEANKTARMYYYQSKIDSFFYWANTLLALAQKHNFPHYEAEANKYIGVTYLIRNQSQKALKAFFKSLKHYHQAQDDKGKAMIFNNIGIIYYDIGSYAQAIDAYQKALAINQRLQHFVHIATAQNNLGNVYKMRGQYKIALIYHLKALRIRQKIGDKKGEGASWSNIGILEQYLKNYEKAKQYFQKAIKIAQEVQNLEGQAIALNNLGEIYDAQKKYNLAEGCYRQSLKLNQKLKIPKGWGTNLSNLGMLAFRQKQYSIALKYYQKALIKHRQIKHQEGVCLTLIRLSDVYWRTQQLDTALTYAQQSYQIAKKLNLKRHVLESLRVLSNLYYQQGGYQRAYDLQKTYISYQDSVLNTTKLKEMEELKTIYETERKQDSIVLLTLNLAKQKDSIQLKQANLELLKKSQRLQTLVFKQAQHEREARLQKIASEKEQQARAFQTQEKSRQQEIKFLAKKDELNTSLLQNASLQKRNLLISGGIAILLLVIIAGWLFINQRQRTRLAKERLKRQNVISQFEYLKHQVSPHFLLNSLNALASLIQEDSKKAHTFALKFSQLYLFVLELKDNLIVSLEDEFKFCEAYLALQQIRFGDNLKIDYEISTDKSQVSLPPLALQIALENAVKHNQISAQAPLHIRIFEEAKKLVVQNNLQKKATHVANSTHIGLQNIKERYKLLGKEQPEFIESTTDFTVKLPLSL